MVSVAATNGQAPGRRAPAAEISGKSDLEGSAGCQNADITVHQARGQTSEASSRVGMPEGSASRPADWVFVGRMPEITAR